MFKNRREAGQQLAQMLADQIVDRHNTIVIALGRGGVAVGYEIAQLLNIPLEIKSIKKVPYEHNPECAYAAVTDTGTIYIDPSATANKISSKERSWLQKEIHYKQHEAHQARMRYYGNRSSQQKYDKNIILVDDGIATGCSIFAALRDIKSYRPKQVTIAVPIMPYSIYRKLIKQGDKVITIEAPRDFAGSVGAYYTDFREITDVDVMRYIQPLWQDNHHTPTNV